MDGPPVYQLFRQKHSWVAASGRDKVAHREYTAWDMTALRAMVHEEESGKPLLVDVKRLFSRADAEKAGFAYWGL